MVPVFALQGLVRDWPFPAALKFCLVAVAIFAGFHLWQYYMLTPWTRDARIRAELASVLSGDGPSEEAGLLVAEALHQRWPQADEGALTRARSMLQSPRPLRRGLMPSPLYRPLVSM
mgnify:CR=1 FL=1